MVFGGFGTTPEKWEMDALIRTLPAQIARYRSKFVILSSPLETYYREIKNILLMKEYAFLI